MSKCYRFIAVAEESIKEECPDAYIQGSLEIIEPGEWISIKNENIYCEKYRMPKSFLYNHDKTGILVVTEEHRCTCTDDKAHCILRNLK